MPGTMMFRATLYRVIAVVTLSVALIACTRTAAREPRAAACQGERIVIVTNNWNRAVDVYASAGSASPIILGSVLPGGRDEFVMPFESTYAYTRPTDGAPTGNTTQGGAQLRYQCRR
jgi:hypothetical protein